MPKPEAVFDSNILISALNWPGKCKELLERALAGNFELVVSRAILNEVVGILGEEFNWPEDRLDEFLNLIPKVAKLVRPKKKVKIVKDDPDDDRILEAALAGKTEYIISGDHHLLNLKKFKGINIVTASKFLEILSGSPNK